MPVLAPKRSRTGIVIAGIAIAILIAIGAFSLYTFGFFDFSRKSLSADQQAYAAFAAARTQESLAQAAADFEQLRTATTTAWGKAKYSLEEAQARMPYEPQAAYELLREIAGNTAYPSFYRAYAVELMADAYQLGDPTPQFAASYIFVGQPFVSFLSTSSPADATRNLRSGITALYRYSRTLSDATSTLPISNYRIANSYVAPLRTASSTKLTPSQRQGYLANAERAYLQGNRGLSAFSRIAPAGIVGYAYWMQASVLGGLAVANASSTERSLAEARFQQAIAYLGMGSGRLSEEQRMWAEFSYALYLYRAYGTQRADTIRPLLDDIAAVPDASTFYLPNYFKNTASTLGRDAQSVRAEEIRALAGISPSFKSYVASLGWNTESPSPSR